MLDILAYSACGNAFLVALTLFLASNVYGTSPSIRKLAITLSVFADINKAGERDSDEGIPDSAFVDAESNADSDFKSAGEGRSSVDLQVNFMPRRNKG